MAGPLGTRAMSKRFIILALLAALAAAKDIDLKKARRLAAQGRKLQQSSKELWKQFVFEHEKLTDKELKTLIRNYDKAIDLYQGAIEVEETPTLNGLIRLLSKRTAQARFVQTAREVARRPKRKPKPRPAPPREEGQPPATPPATPKEPEEPAPVPRIEVPQLKGDELPELIETPTQQRLGKQALRNFIMNHYFASRKFSALISRCSVCNGRGKVYTGHIDKYRKPILVPCGACNHTGGHLNVAKARKGYWLVHSPLYRSDAGNRDRFERQLAGWQENPSSLTEFLKRVAIVSVEYHGLWAEVTLREKAYRIGSKRSTERVVVRKMLRAGKRWFFYDERFDKGFFAVDDPGDG